MQGFVKLGTLPPGTRVRTESGTEATLISANECRARVKIGGARIKTATFKVPDVTGEKQVTKSWSAEPEEANWGFGTMVQVVAGGAA